MDYSLPGSSIHGIFQARVLESGAIAFSAERVYTWGKAARAPGLGRVFRWLTKWARGEWAGGGEWSLS